MVAFSRRRFGALAAGAMVVALTGCGGEDEPDAKDLDSNKAGAMADFKVGQQFKATEALTFPILYNNHPNYPLKKDWLFWSELTKMTNVTLQPTEVPLSDYEQKRSLLIGAGDAPVIIPKTYPHSEDPFVAAGQVLAVSDYLDLMPNFKDKVAKWKLEPELDTIKQADGKFYLLPGLHEDAWPDYTIAMRTDVLKELGLQQPTSWDEFYTTLKAIKAKYPNQYPFSDRWSQPTPAGALQSLMSPTFGTQAGWTYNNATWDAAQSKFVFTGTQPQYKTMVEYLNKLVAEKLMDPESFTQSDDQAVAKFVSGKSFAISTNAQELINKLRGPLAKANPNGTVAKILLPAGPAGNVIPGTTRLENGVMILAKAKESKNFVAMMQFLDWLYYSDAGQEFTKWGVLGTTYNKDASGKRTLAADIDYVGLNPKGTKKLNADYGFSNGVFAYGGSTELLESVFSDEEKAWQAEMRKKTVLPVPPGHPLTEEEREQAALWETPLKDAVSAATLQFILGQRPLSDWDKYAAEVQGKNAQQYIDLINKAYDRLKGSK